MEWVTQIKDFYSKWLEYATVSSPLPCIMFTMKQRKEIHLDFIKVTDFLGTIYREHEGLINVQPNIRLKHMTNCDKAFGNVRKCFKWIETYVISNNYFRSIEGLPTAPYPECQPSQRALEQNSLEYLTSLAQLQVNSVNRLLEQNEMYHDGNAVSKTSNSPTP